MHNGRSVNAGHQGCDMHVNSYVRDLNPCYERKTNNVLCFLLDCLSNTMKMAQKVTRPNTKTACDNCSEARFRCETNATPNIVKWLTQGDPTDPKGIAEYDLECQRYQVKSKAILVCGSV